MSDDPNIDKATGLEFFIFKGQKRYRCPTKWESGDRCQRDHYDPQWILEHAREPHTASGNRNVKVVRQAVSSLVDSGGKQIIYDIPSDLSDVHFKK